MAGEILSTNMNLPVPGVGVTFGPQWASDINNCLTIIDGHNHTPGYGVVIPPAGLNINSDLTFNNNNATALRSSRYQPQSNVLTLPADLTCVYVVGLDLYYNDGSSNNVRLTQNGAVAGAPGSIANLVAPASASYVSGSSTFVFQSNVNTPANLDGASVIIRDLTANSNGVTLSAPTALASNITITLPTLPIATSVLTIDPSGQISTLPGSGGLVPSGVIVQDASSTIPSGYLLNDGSAVSRTTYASLFGAIGTRFGAGDGSTTFNVPLNINPQFYGGNGQVPSYVQSYWKMNQSTGGEPNFGSGGGTYDLVPFGPSAPSSPGHVTGVNSRGPFSVSNDYFTVPLGGSTSTPYDNQQFAVGFWMNSGSIGSNEGILGKGANNGSIGWSVNINTSGQIFIALQGNVYTVTNVDVADNNWHLVFVCNLVTSGASNFRVYIDNQLQFSTAGQTYTPVGNDMKVGVTDLNSLNQFSGGLLTLVEFWDTVPATWVSFENLINQRWNNGAGYDYSSAIPVNAIIKT